MQTHFTLVCPIVVTITHMLIPKTVSPVFTSFPNYKFPTEITEVVYSKLNLTS